jgi:N-acetyl-anhydromuramyl-L-alanine amidase AmpD
VLRRTIYACVAAIAACLGGPPPADARTVLEIEDQYSTWNRTRPKRSRTHYIVLHTTESGGRSALEKLRRNGEAHYLVDTDGRIYRIIDKNKVARHAGLSLWEGRRDLDNFSIGIEVAGYHDGKFGADQLAALRELIRQLRSRYGIRAENVVPHSMVAYGRPNRFQDTNHRGRTRCAMVFARPEVRELIGLNARPRRDRDVEKGMLKVGDPELFNLLFPP